MKKMVKMLSAALVLVSVAISCDSMKDLIGGSEDMEEITEEKGDGSSDEGGDGSEEENDEVKVNDYLIEIGAEGVSDVNMLEFCINMTHLYKYTVTGLEDCTWARVRHVQNWNGNDWTPLLTVDPNDTGMERVVKITVSLDRDILSKHEIRQKK